MHQRALVRPLPPRSHLYRHLARNGLIASGFVAGSLALGVLGYHHFEHLSALDSLLNAAMILGGMGPVDPVRSAGGKLFAACYALFSGICFLVIAGVLFAPLIHRFLHRFHYEILDQPERDE